VKFKFEWHSNSNSKAKLINPPWADCPSQPTSLLLFSRETRPASARPSPPPSFLFLRTAQPTATAAQPSRPLVAPFTFRPGQLTSGARLSAFPSSSRRAPPRSPRLRSLCRAFSSFACATLPRSRHQPAPRLACPRSATWE
jgi:hypothetical protein